MVGSALTRYSETPFLLFDTETAYPSLNLARARPWELSYAIATLKGGISLVRTHFIRWPNMVITEDNPSFKHFDRARYEREAKDPREVWDEFSPLLYGGKHRPTGHNLVGFDQAVIDVWRRLMGLVPDSSWLYYPVLDTNCVAKAYRAQWTPDISSPEACVAWQYRCYHQRLAKGVKTKLGVMCQEFGIPYDLARAHEAEYDIRVNWEVAKQLIWKVEV